MKIIQITYEITLDIDTEFLYKKSNGEMDSLTQDEIEEIEEQNSFFTELMNRFESSVKKEKIIYTIGPKTIRCDRIFQKPEFNVKTRFEIIDNVDRISKTYVEKQNGEINIYEINLDRSNYAKAEFEYAIKEYENDTKVIQGYLCHKLIVDEIIKFKKDGRIENNRFECYVTNEINFPLDLLGLSKRVTEKCPLELKYFKLDRGSSTQLFKATSIENIVEEDYLKLPDRFKKEN